MANSFPLEKTWLIKDKKGMADSTKYSNAKITPNELIALRKDAKWVIPAKAAFRKSISKTVYSISARKNGRIIGYGRIIGDSALLYCVSDVIVLKEFQGRRIGTGIMDRLMGYVRKKAVPGAFIGLFSAQNLEPFYEKYGFKQRPIPGTGSGAGMSYIVPAK